MEVINANVTHAANKSDVSLARRELTDGGGAKQDSTLIVSDLAAAAAEGRTGARRVRKDDLVIHQDIFTEIGSGRAGSGDTVIINGRRAISAEMEGESGIRWIVAIGTVANGKAVRVGKTKPVHNYGPLDFNGGTNRGKIIVNPDSRVVTKEEHIGSRGKSGCVAHLLQERTSARISS